MKEGLAPVYTISNGGVPCTNPTNWGPMPASESPAWDAVIPDWTANGYRLPTEMEWMWAAMGASSDGLIGDIANGVNTNGYSKGYAGSIENGGAQAGINSYAWTSENDDTNTEPAGILMPNELGLYDMSGNVWQDCWDWSEVYPGVLLLTRQAIMALPLVLFVYAGVAAGHRIRH